MCSPERRRELMLKGDLTEFMREAVLEVLPRTLDEICERMSEADRGWVSQVLGQLRAEGLVLCTPRGLWQRGHSPVRTRYERMLSDEEG